jgi:methyl-accepting chemotaxis protein
LGIFHNNSKEGRYASLMKKIFTQRLFYYMLAALVITITAIFCLQTAVNRADNTRSSQAKLEDVRQKLASNEANIAQLTENLSQDNLAKTRAFADILAADRSSAIWTSSIRSGSG